LCYAVNQVSLLFDTSAFILQNTNLLQLFFGTDYWLQVFKVVNLLHGLRHCSLNMYSVKSYGLQKIRWTINF